MPSHAFHYENQARTAPSHQSLTYSCRSRGPPNTRLAHAIHQQRDSPLRIPCTATSEMIDDLQRPSLEGKPPCWKTYIRYTLRGLALHLQHWHRRLHIIL